MGDDVIVSKLKTVDAGTDQDRNLDHRVHRSAGRRRRDPDSSAAAKVGEPRSRRTFRNVFSRLWTPGQSIRVGTAPSALTLRLLIVATSSFRVAAAEKKPVSFG
jgi:hypothetical protein